MKILRLDAKHDSMYFDVSSKKKRLAAMRLIFDMNSWMYDDEDDPNMIAWLVKATAGDNQSAQKFVETRSRLGCEYETLRMINVLDATKEPRNENSFR